MALSGILKTMTWLTRLVQWLLAIVLVGVGAYMIEQYRDGHFVVPAEVSLPTAASVLAAVIATFSIVAICFLGYTLQLVAAALDFVIFVLYLASAALLRHNYRSRRSPLRLDLVFVRLAQGENPHRRMQGDLVRVLVDLVVIQTLLFLFTTLMGFAVASRHEDRGARRRTRVAV